MLGPEDISKDRGKRPARLAWNWDALVFGAPAFQTRGLRDLATTGPQQAYCNQSRIVSHIRPKKPATGTGSRAWMG